MPKSNAEIAEQVRVRALRRGGSLAVLKDEIAIALSAAQSTLAKAVLEEIAVPNVNVAISPALMKRAIDARLRDLFTRLNIHVEEAQHDGNQT